MWPSTAPKLHERGAWGSATLEWSEGALPRRRALTLQELIGDGRHRALDVC